MSGKCPAAGSTMSQKSENLSDKHAASSLQAAVELGEEDGHITVIRWSFFNIYWTFHVGYRVQVIFAGLDSNWRLLDENIIRHHVVTTGLP